MKKTNFEKILGVFSSSKSSTCDGYVRKSSLLSPSLESIEPFDIHFRFGHNSLWVWLDSMKKSNEFFHKSTCSFWNILILMWNDAIDWNFGFFKWDCQKKNLNVWSWSRAKYWTRKLKSKFQNFASAMLIQTFFTYAFQPFDFFSLGTSAVEYLAFVFIKIGSKFLPENFFKIHRWNGLKRWKKANGNQGCAIFQLHGRYR